MSKKAHRVRNGRFKKILIVLVAIIGFPFAIIVIINGFQGRKP